MNNVFDICLEESAQGRIDLLAHSKRDKGIELSLSMLLYFSLSNACHVTPLNYINVSLLHYMTPSLVLYI